MTEQKDKKNSCDVGGKTNKMSYNEEIARAKFALQTSATAFRAKRSRWIPPKVWREKNKRVVGKKDQPQNMRWWQTTGEEELDRNN